MAKTPLCPVCGAQPSETDMIEKIGWGPYVEYFPGTSHCPNEHDDDHLTYRGSR